MTTGKGISCKSLAAYERCLGHPTGQPMGKRTRPRLSSAQTEPARTLRGVRLGCSSKCMPLLALIAGFQGPATGKFPMSDA
jgi:hypothetical protein